jgi:hypothetical protein
MILNETLEFSSAPQTVKKAFLGMPDKLLLRPGRKLFKWTEFPLVGDHGVTPWWLFAAPTRLPSGAVADGFRRSEDLAHRLGVSHSSYQKVRSAVSGKFRNSMRYLLLVEITAPVWGFAGKASGQLEFSDEQEFNDPSLKKVYLLGGSVQLWVPNLKDNLHVRELPTLERHT